MTIIRLKIEGGKVTFMQQQGTEIPYPLWDVIVATVSNIVERAHDKREGEFEELIKGMGNYYEDKLVEPEDGFGRSNVTDAYMDGIHACLTAIREVYGINFLKLDFNDEQDK